MTMHAAGTAESAPARVPFRLILLHSQIHAEVFQSFLEIHLLAMMCRFVANHVHLVQMPRNHIKTSSTGGLYFSPFIDSPKEFMFPLTRHGLLPAQAQGNSVLLI